MSHLVVKKSTKNKDKFVIFDKDKQKEKGKPEGKEAIKVKATSLDHKEDKQTKERIEKYGK